MGIKNIKINDQKEHQHKEVDKIKEQSFSLWKNQFNSELTLMIKPIDFILEINCK